MEIVVEFVEQYAGYSNMIARIRLGLAMGGELTPRDHAYIPIGWGGVVPMKEVVHPDTQN